MYACLYTNVYEEVNYIGRYKKLAKNFEDSTVFIKNETIFLKLIKFNKEGVLYE